MADLTQQLDEEHKRVVGMFAGSPYVSLTFSDGDPPRRYEVEYSIKGGVKQEDGSIQISESHRVAILLPFGYPNFPPICKPLTPTFHPDFGSAAICISSYWDVFKSLPGLITHIGRMIAGQIYGTEDALNPEAAKWYEENGNKLPFASVNLEKGVDDLSVDVIEEPPDSREAHKNVELPVAGSETLFIEEMDLSGDGFAPIEDITFSGGSDEGGGEEALQPGPDALDDLCTLKDAKGSSSGNKPPVLDVLSEELSVSQETQGELDLSFDPDETLFMEDVDSAEAGFDGLEDMASSDGAEKGGDDTGLNLDEQGVLSGRQEDDDAPPEEPLKLDMETKELSSSEGNKEELDLSFDAAETLFMEGADPAGDGLEGLDNKTSPEAPLELGTVPEELPSSQEITEELDLPSDGSAELFLEKTDSLIDDPGSVKEKTSRGGKGKENNDRDHRTERKKETSDQRGRQDTNYRKVQRKPNVASAGGLPDGRHAGGMEKEEVDHAVDPAALYAEEQRIKKKKTIRIAAILGICLIVFGGAYIFIMDILHYQNAENIWRETPLLLEQQKYKEVQSRGRLALKQLAMIHVLKKSDGARLKREIDRLLKTKKFQRGLAGKVLFDGNYVGKETIPARQAIKKAMEKGDEPVAAGEWNSALQFFREARRLAKTITLDDKDIPTEIEKSIADTQLNLFLMEGNDHLEAGELDDAVAIFQKAAELANNRADIDDKRVASVHKSLDKAMLRRFIKEGAGAFAAVQLDKALSSYEQALQLAEKETVSSHEDAAGIRNSIQQIKLYQLLEKGKTEYDASEWDAALQNFQKALRFIMEDTSGNPELLANEPVIRKKILQLTVKISENKAASLKAQNKLKEALQEQKRVVSDINNSAFKDDPEFVGILEKARSDISSLKHEIDVAEKIAYLTKHYQKIFTDNHALARSAILRYPVIELVKQEGKNQLYSMKCIAYTITGKISLELIYFYDGATRKWSLYNKK
jgi:ubiquitin-protein ligase